MIDGVDQDRRAEIPEEQGFILARFLREPEFDTNKKNLLEIIPNEKFSIEKKIFSEIKSSKFSKKENLYEEIIPLHGINPLILERENVDRRLDRFIIREGINRRIPQEVDRVLPLDNLPVPNLDPKRWFYSPTGLHASVFVGYTRSLTVDGEKMMLKDYNYIHFTPEGRGHFNRSKMTKSLASGIQGVVELVDAVDQGRFEAAQVFVGMTNINMALIAQRLGFVIIDECRNQDGSINKNLSYFTVVGKLVDIRARVGEFKRAGVTQRLEQRNQRSQAKPKPVPVGA